jgi:hypothetical protein
LVGAVEKALTLAARMAAAIDAMVRAGPAPRILHVKDAAPICRFFTATEE